MTHDDIIRMAREAGLKFPSETELSPQEKKFAELVIAAERKQNLDLVQIIVEAEREACAQMVERMGMNGYGTLAIAGAIRVRRET